MSEQHQLLIRILESLEPLILAFPSEVAKSAIINSKVVRYPQTDIVTLQIYWPAETKV